MEAGRQVRSYLGVLLCGWAVLAAAGCYYARLKGIALASAWPVLAAFLAEYAFYLLPGFRGVLWEVRERIPLSGYAALLAASAVAPYLIYSTACGQFAPDPFLRLCVLALFIAYWFVFRPPSRIADVALVALLVVVTLLRFFSRVYVSPFPEVRIDVLGQLMLIRLAAAVFLTIREEPASGFGFLPARRDWQIGAKWFLLFLPVWIALGFLVRALHYSPNLREFRMAPAVFAGILWVVALSEEFLFRGLIQRWIAEKTGGIDSAIVVASVIFGLCHLGFGSFPNYRFALIAAIGGWFYGKAFAETGSIRTSMVAHALTVTAWRTFF
jgi:membrane protease YdiL (CAAX protease family)